MLDTCIPSGSPRRILVYVSPSRPSGEVPLASPGRFHVPYEISPQGGRASCLLVRFDIWAPSSLPTMQRDKKGGRGGSWGGWAWAFVVFWGKKTGTWLTGRGRGVRPTARTVGEQGSSSFLPLSQPSAKRSSGFLASSSPPRKKQIGGATIP